MHSPMVPSEHVVPVRVSLWRVRDIRRRQAKARDKETISAMRERMYKLQHQIATSTLLAGVVGDSGWE